MRNLEYTPIQTEDVFIQWLTHQEQSGESITSAQLAEAQFYLLEQYDHGHEIKLDHLKRLEKLYPQGLLNGRPDDPNTVASMIKYVGERMPTLIFRKKLKAIHFTNSTSEIMDVVHVSRALRREKRRKHGPKRCRWYKRFDFDEKHSEVTFHVRDVLLQDPTDAFEMLSWFGSLEQARESVVAMIKRGEDITPIEIAFRELYETHVRSEIEMLKKKKVALKNKEPKLMQSIENRLEELVDRMNHLDTLAAELFSEWVSKDREDAIICPEHPNQKVLGGWSGIKELNAAEMTMDIAKNKIETEKLKNPTDLLFGNDFSMRIFLSIGLFSEQEFVQMGNAFEAKRSEISPSLEKLSSQEVRDAAEKFFLVQQLSQYVGSDLVIQKLRERLFSPETFEKIGINRLVATADSPIADPVDLIDVTQIHSEIFFNLPTFLQTILTKLKTNNRTILSVPYTLGNLSRTTLEAAVAEFPSLESENFIGKVGNYSKGVNQKVSVGDVILGNQVFSQFEDDAKRIENPIAELIAQYGYPVKIASLLTTAGLTFQQPAEMAEILDDPLIDELCLEMEAFHLMEALENLRLKNITLKSNHVYYVSDITTDPKSFDQKLHGADKISESLGARGSIPLFICLLAILENLGQSK